MPRLSILIAAAVLVAAPCGASAVDYYFDSVNGRDNGGGYNGSPSKPYQTITKLNSLDLNPGDAVYLKGVFSGKVFFDSGDSGTDAAPVTLTSWGGSNATIQAGNDAGIYAYNSGGFNISNLSLVGSGLTARHDATRNVDYLGTDNTAAGISLYNDAAGDVIYSHIHIENVDVSGFKTGFSAGSWQATGNTGHGGYNDLRVTNSVLHDNQNGGLGTYSYNGYKVHTNVYVGNVKAYNAPGDYFSTGNTGSGITLGGVNGGTIERCVAHDNGVQNHPNLNGGGTEGPVGIWTYSSNAVTIQYNESYNNKTDNGADGGGFDLDGGTTNSVVQFNYSHGNQGAGYLLGEYSGSTSTTGNVIRYNISQNDGQKNNYAGIYIYNHSSPTTKVTSNYIYNNTVYSSSGGGNVAIAGNLTNSNNVFANNIFITTGSVLMIRDNRSAANAASGVTFLGNDYFNTSGNFRVKWGGTTYTSLDSWLAAATTQERLTIGGQPTVVALLLDPKLVNAGGGGTLDDANALNTLTAYRLNAASLLYDAGIDLHALFGIDPGNVDFYGLALPEGWGYSVGANEMPQWTGPRGVWVGGSGANWSNPANWLYGTPLNGSNLLVRGSSASSINDLPVTSVGNITFDTGAGPVNLGGAALTVTGNITNNSTAKQTIAASVTLVGSGVIDTASGDIEISGLLNPVAGLIKNGNGELTISSAAGLVSSATTTVKQGTLTVTAGIDGAGALIVSDGSATASVFADHVRQSSLTIHDKGKVKITGGGGAAGTSVIGSLAIALPGNGAGELAASVETVPEPSAVVLALLGLLGPIAVKFAGRQSRTHRPVQPAPPSQSRRPITSSRS